MAPQIRFGSCNEMFEGWDMARQLSYLREAGYEGVELAPFTIAQDVREVPAAKRAEVAAQAKAAGIEVIGLHWLLVGPEGMYITHTDPAVRARTAEYLAELMHFCADVSGSVLVFGSPAQRNLLPGVTKEAARAWLIDGFERALPVAERTGVTLCLEPLPPPECTFIQTTTEAIDVIESIDHPNLRLVLDVKSMAGEERLTRSPIPDTIRRTARHVKHVQSNDTNRGHPGSGETDYVPIFRALDDVGYEGFVSVEAFDFTPGPETIAKESIEYMRRTMAEARAGGR
ncbi:MAG TPA: sugar phosphate isomerase/epimerase family protein [Chloroflexota bacterium]|nr:sugar phosphate isomerase/epimerase family protein [Chloroflexota bacterium]